MPSNAIVIPPAGDRSGEAATALDAAAPSPWPKDTLGIVFTGKEQAELRRIPLPEVGPGTVLVRTIWSMISTGTETIAYGRRFDAGTHWDRWVRYPFPTGYSNVGVVEAVGAEVASLRPGDRVASFGHHARFVVQRAEHCYPIPQGVCDRDATWFALSGVAQNGVRAVDHALGDDVAVIGLGPIGQLVVQFVRLLGAQTIFAVDPSAERVDQARRHGATHPLPVAVAEAAAAIRELTGERMCDVVHDVTGNDHVFTAALQLLRHRGTLNLIGDTGSPTGQRLDSAMMEKSLRVIATHGTFAPPAETHWSRWTRCNMFQLFFRFLADGRMKVADLNTHVFSPRDCQATYQKLLHDRAGTMGCHFSWDHATD